MDLSEMDVAIKKDGSFVLFLIESVLWISFTLGTIIYFAYQGFFAESGQQLASAHQIIGIGGLYFFGFLYIFVLYNILVDWSFFGVKLVSLPTQLLLLAAGPTWLVAREIMTSPSLAVGVGYFPIIAAGLLIRRKMKASPAEDTIEAVESTHN